MNLTSVQQRQAKKALLYYDTGIPIKDAFDRGSDEEVLFVACMRVALAASKPEQAA